MRTGRWFASIAVALLCASCSGASAGPPHLHVNLSAGPFSAPFDTPVHITVSGLPAGGLVTLRAQALDSQGRPWESAAQFRASAAGGLDLATAAPVSGSYRTADAAGLLWSLHPAFAAGPATQFFTSHAGFVVQLQVVVDGGVQAAATLVRLATSGTSVSVQTVARNGFAATLFTPASVKPGTPAVVVLGGSEGGELTLTADGLALIGFPALTLGYFQEPGLPRCLCSIPLEYFVRAIGWLRAQPVARGRPVVLYGVSRGAEGALLIASYEPHLVDAVVASSPSNVIVGAYGGPGPAWTLHGRPLPTGAEIPVGNIRVPLLLGDGGQDYVWPSAASAASIVFELHSSGDHAPYTNLYYPDAGHGFFGGPPYFPYSGYGGLGNPLGGSQQANALAIEQFWTKMIAFINSV
ncbi:MAG TPA: acyl-CoA thioesterase/bile acid-CoA:amino acid N-acyltransferase family protein [Streptosporangiaceae bacterium]